MPIYTFQCRDCGHEVDEITSSETKTVDCPHCEKHTAVRLPAIPAQAAGYFGTTHKKPTKNAVPFKFRDKGPKGEP